MYHKRTVYFCHSRLYRVSAAGKHTAGVRSARQRRDWVLHPGSQGHVAPPSGTSATNR